MDKIKKIEIGFENCETAMIENSHIQSFKIKGINNSNIEYPTCEEMYIEIRKNANKPYFSFGELTTTPLFKRITDYSDIAFIEITFENGKISTYYLPWTDYPEEDFLTSNEFQTSYIDDSGNIHIYVSKKQTVNEYLGGLL